MHEEKESLKIEIFSTLIMVAIIVCT